MNHKYVIVLILSVLLTGTFFSCQQYETDASGKVKDFSYNGTLYAYLSDKTAHPEATYDSLLYLVNKLPGLKDSLENTKHEFTLFAVSDKSFGNALNALNRLRQTNEKGRNLSLKDFLIEPFTVTDTVITQISSSGLMDTTIVTRRYDYRSQMDSLVCRYIYDKPYTTSSIMEIGNAIEAADVKYNENLRIEVGRYAASGVVSSGMRYMSLVETGGSKLTTSWVKAGVSQYDVKAVNGWIHILQPNHEFGFNEMETLFQNYGNEKKK